MKPQDLAALLRDLHRDKLALRERHVAVARHVDHYDHNNTYQYVIAREDQHLAWLEAALAELGAEPGRVDPVVVPRPDRRAGYRPLVEADARDAAALVARWSPRAAGVGHARHQGMVEVILGETLEHKRFFDQVLEGRDDLLGRRANGPASPGTGHGVLPERWLG